MRRGEVTGRASQRMEEHPDEGKQVRLRGCTWDCSGRHVFFLGMFTCTGTNEERAGSWISLGFWCAKQGW